MDNDVKAPADAATNTVVNIPSISPQKKAIASIALVTALAASVITGINWEKSMTVQKQLLSVQQHLQQQQQSTMTMSQQIATLLAQTQRQQAALAQTSSEVQRLSAQDPNFVAKQTLQEIAHIIREAMLNLNVSNNIPAAIALLQSADQRAQTLTLTGTHSLRELFAKNITALQMLIPIDTEGLINKLVALQNQIEQIPLFVAPDLKTAISQPIAIANNPVNNWRQGLQETWQALQKIVVIRHRNEPVMPLLSPDQHLYLKQNLQLLLQQAIWAIMQRQDKVYQTSLQQAITWIQRYYTSNQAGSMALVTTLQGLQKIELRPALPELMPLLQQAQQMQAETQKAVVTPNNSAVGAQPARQVGAL